MNSFLTPGVQQSRTQLREQFLHDALTILGDTRLLWTPKPTDTTTSLDESLTGRTLTHDATIAARLGSLGLGYYTTFNGTSQYATTPDTANLSFGNGTVDSPFSIVALVNVTDSAAQRQIISKEAGGQLEWAFQISTADLLQLRMDDQSAGVQVVQATNSAITQGAFVLLGATYSAATGGATAASDVTLYQNGVSLAATPVNNGAYVAMENGTSTVDIGSWLTHTGNYFLGSMAFVALCQTNLSASDHWALKRLINAYFGLSL